MSKKKNILVPTDFTKVADTAMNHAMKLATYTEGEVFILHGKKLSYFGRGSAKFQFPPIDFEIVQMVVECYIR